MAVTSPTNKSMDWKVLTGLVVVIIVYLILGAVSFHVIEHKHEIRQREHILNYTAVFLEQNPCVSRDDLRELVIEVLNAYDQGILATNETHTSHWDIWSSMFFSSTIITTIGYGHISPNTFVGKLVCIFYALLGIPLCLTMLAGVGEKMMKVTIKLDNCINCCHKCPKFGTWFRTIFLLTMGITIFLLIPACIFSRLENWTFFEGLYFGFISLTTIGLGDYVAGTSAAPEHTWYRILVSLWLGLGLAWVATLISSIRENLQDLMGHGETKMLEIQDRILKQVRSPSKATIEGDIEGQTYKRNESSANELKMHHSEDNLSYFPDSNDMVTRISDHNRNSSHSENGEAHIMDNGNKRDSIKLKELHSKDSHKSGFDNDHGLVNGPTNHNVVGFDRSTDGHMDNGLSNGKSDSGSQKTVTNNKPALLFTNLNSDSTLKRENSEKAHNLHTMAESDMIT